MPRTALTITELDAETASADLGLRGATDHTNGAIVETGDLSRLVFELETGASAATVTFVQADRGPDGLGGGAGDLVVSLAANDVKYVAGLSSARFEQEAEAEAGEVAGVYLDFGGAGAADVIARVVRLPIEN